MTTNHKLAKIPPRVPTEKRRKSQQMTSGQRQKKTTKRNPLAWCYRKRRNPLGWCYKSIDVYASKSAAAVVSYQAPPSPSRRLSGHFAREPGRFELRRARDDDDANDDDDDVTNERERSNDENIDREKNWKRIWRKFNNKNCVKCFFLKIPHPCFLS